MRKIITINLLFLLATTNILAQNNVEKNTKNKTKKELKLIAKQEIEKMHNGVLLIRLKTKTNSISALRKSGKDKLADKIEAKQAAYNLSIISAFKTEFNFCPTYFFFSDQSNLILEGKLDQVQFLNDSLQYDPKIEYNNQPYLTAEFGLIEQDPGTQTDDYYYVEGKDGIEKRTKYNGATNMTFDALIIKNNQFIQQRKPFPYYVRTLNSLPFKRKPKTVVKRMNTQLHAFYSKVN